MRKSLIIILYDHPIDHTSDYAEQACTYLRRDNVVISVLLKDAVSIKELFQKHRWVWPVTCTSSRHIQITPLYFFPFRRFQWVVNLNLWFTILFARVIGLAVSLLHSVRQSYIWVFTPEHYSVVSFFPSNYTIVYDCVDYHGNGELSSDEKKLLQRSSWVFVNSHTLYAHIKPFYKNVVLVPLGFDRLRFVGNGKKLKLLTLCSPPIIGYIGGISSRLDFTLLYTLITHNPQWNFVFIGPIQQRESNSMFEKRVLPHIRSLLDNKNVIHIPEIAKSDIGISIAQFSVCIIPYDSTLAFNANCFPMKLLEYFYAGKPVITTPIKELSRFPTLVQSARTVQQWERAITKGIVHWSMRQKARQRSIAISNTWDEKFKKIVSYISMQ